MSRGISLAVAKTRIMLGEIAGDSQREGEPIEDYIKTLGAVRDAVDRAITLAKGDKEPSHDEG